ncbi:unnamed protein product [Owenia fusiformis]|uniref:Calcineurin-like phosphoesterase domain-containing protein n=1 Tax=Owenia fusiformis TaxID=6347 RepID=A0A8S4Q384_OWEFU|nr:unnamed protein product [Owenia fusiformis]
MYNKFILSVYTMGAILCSLLIRTPPRLTLESQYNLPLPRTIHKTLSRDIIQGKRVFVVGDIHGCYDEFIELVKVADANVDKKEDILIISVGDAINKGPKNIKVLDYIIARKNTIFMVRGNHEDGLLHEYYKHIANDSYQIRKKWQWICDLKKEHIEFISELPYTFSIPDLNAIIVHAGLVPGVPLTEQHPIDMTLMRNIIDYEGINTRGTEKTKQGMQWARLWSGPEHVYFGHDARRRLQQFKYTTGLDTGCVYGGSLTGVYLTGSQEMFSVKPKNVYQPVQ